VSLLFSLNATENDLDHEVNPFEALQTQREGEFLGQLIEPLQDLPEEYAQYATNDLGDRLHQTVREFVWRCICMCSAQIALCARSGDRRYSAVPRVQSTTCAHACSLYTVFTHLASSRQVEIYLSDKDVSDLDGLDTVLTEFLSLPELRADMESFRDEIMHYYLSEEGGDQLGEEQGGDQDHEAAEMEEKGSGAQ
jgi:hypothetical protein